MNDICATVTVESENGPVVINEADFDEKIHKLTDAAEAVDDDPALDPADMDDDQFKEYAEMQADGLKNVDAVKEALTMAGVSYDGITKAGELRALLVESMIKARGKTDE